MDPEVGPVEGFTSRTRELRDNIEIQYDTIADILNVMGEEGRLIRRRKGKKKVLWSLAEDGNQKRTKSVEKPPKTGSQNSERNGNRFVFHRHKKERRLPSLSPRRNPTVKLNQKTD